ncbi:transposase, partial [Xanthomonas oryzae]
FSEEQIIGFLREAEAGVAIKDLEAENTRLKKLLAEQVFQNDLIKDALQKTW